MRLSTRLILAMAVLVLVTAAAVGFFAYRGIEATNLPALPEVATAELAIGWSTLGVGAVALLVATVLGVVLARSLTRPLEQMTAAVQHFAGGPPAALPAALPTDAAGEIGTLARALEGTQTRLGRVNRMYRTIIACNQSLIRGQDEKTLARKICETMVEQGGYRMAWVGYALDDAARTILPIATAGDDSGYVNSLHLSWADNERGNGPGARSIRDGTVQVARDIRTDPTYGFWREEAGKRGYASSISMPLQDSTGTFGFLGIYSGEPDAFDAEEVKLLTRVSEDLAFGIATSRERAERLRAEEELMKSQLALTDVQAALARAARITTMGELAASIAHEINQPLAAAVTNSDAALRWLANEPPDLAEARAALQRTIRDANRASDVIKRIRAMLAKHEREDVALDLNEMVHEVLALTRNEQHARHVAVEARLTAGLPPVRGDRVQLQQAVLNLVMNAIEAMSTVADRPLVLRVASRRADNGDVLLAVEDTGSGVDPAVAERLFDPFYTTKPGGMGMGLAITRSIVEDHGGRLWAAPGSASGAVFLFTLPPAREHVA